MNGFPRTRWFIPLLLVAGAFGVVLASVESVVFDLERFQLPKTLALHVTALGLLAVGLRGLRMRSWNAFEALAAAFVTWSALSALLATNRWLALASWGVAFSALIVLRGAGSVTGQRQRDFAVGGILLAVAVGALLGVAQAYGWDAPWLAQSRPPGGTFGNRNFLAHMSAIAAPALLVLGVSHASRRARLLATLGLGVVVLAVVLTRSRAAWLGGAVALAVAGYGLFRARRVEGRPARAGTGWALVVLLGAIGGAVAIPNALEWRDASPYVGTLTRLTDFREGSGRGRLIQYRNSLELAADHPVLGVGPGNWFVHYPTVTEDGDPAYGGHLAIPTNPWPSSDWVAMVSERGPLAALFLLGSGLLMLAVGLVRAGGGGAAGNRGAAAAGVVSAAAVTGLFDAVLLLPAPAFVVAALVGLFLAEDDAADRHPAAAPPRRALKAAAAAVALALVIFTGIHTRAVASTATSRDTATLSRAAALAPWDHRVRLLLAERGRCADARSAARLMPFHPHVQALIRDCGS